MHHYGYENICARINTDLLLAHAKQGQAPLTKLVNNLVHGIE
jgi:hypothetical protein